MTHEERVVFNSYYCRMCYCLRMTGGQYARFLTTFDMTLYSMIYNLSAKESPPPVLPCQKVGKSHLKYFENDETGIRLARLTFIALGEKIADDMRDEKSLKVKFANSLFGKSIARAIAAEPEIARIAHEGCQEVNDLQDGGADAFAVFDAYGRSVVNIFSLFGGASEAALAALRDLARWTFFVDMLCDYDEDYANAKAYNAFKTEGCPTLDDYFDGHYNTVLEYNRRISGELTNSLLAIADDSLEYRGIYKMISHGQSTVVKALLSGKDIRYKYFREQAKRIWKEITGRKKSNFI